MALARNCQRTTHPTSPIYNIRVSRHHFIGDAALRDLSWVITSSATASSLSGMVRLSALVVVMGIVQVDKTYIGRSAFDRHCDKTTL